MRGQGRTSMVGFSACASRTGWRAPIPSAFMTGMDSRRLMKGRVSASSRNMLMADAVRKMSPISTDPVRLKACPTIPPCSTHSRACDASWTRRDPPSYPAAHGRAEATWLVAVAFREKWP